MRKLLLSLIFSVVSNLAASEPDAKVVRYFDKKFSDCIKGERLHAVDIQHVERFDFDKDGKDEILIVGTTCHGDQDPPEWHTSDPDIQGVYRVTGDSLALIPVNNDGPSRKTGYSVPPLGLGLKRIVVDGDRSPLIIANQGYQDVVAMIVGFRPDLVVRTTRYDRFYERFANRSARWRRV